MLIFEWILNGFNEVEEKFVETHKKFSSEMLWCSEDSKTYEPNTQSSNSKFDLNNSNDLKDISAEVLEDIGKSKERKFGEYI